MNIYLRKSKKQDKRMWSLNYINMLVLEEATTILHYLSTHDADGVLMFFKTY